MQEVCDVVQNGQVLPVRENCTGAAGQLVQHGARDSILLHKQP